MAVYKRGGVYWYKFKFNGAVVRESAHTGSKDVAVRAERERRRRIELGANHLEEVPRPQILSVILAEWLKGNPHWSANTARINRTNCDHLKPFFGRILVNEVTPAAIGRYQTQRLHQQASPKTINLEVATLRQILRERGYWAPLQGKVKMLRTQEEVGRALTQDEIARIDSAARRSRSRSLAVALILYRFTGMRLSEARTMTWSQVDLIDGYIVTGRGKTKAGEGRRIPLAPTALRALNEWSGKFPGAKPSHYVFPSERYGLDGEKGYKDGDASVYDINPEKPISSWKTAWTTCRKLAGVTCRTHDYRHSFVSMLAENPEVSDSTLMALTGHVSKRMLDHYTHSRIEAKRRAVSCLETAQERADSERLGRPEAQQGAQTPEGAQKWAQ